MARPTLFTHPKFRRLCHELKLSVPLALGHLELLWRVAYESGDALIGDEIDVELASQWEGNPGAWAATLLRLHLLDQSPEGLSIHDLRDHEPEYVKDRRRKEAERRAAGIKARDETRHQETSVRDASRKFPDESGTVPEVSGTPAPAPAPAPVKGAGGRGEPPPAPSGAPAARGRDESRKTYASHTPSNGNVAANPPRDRKVSKGDAEQIALTMRELAEFDRLHPEIAEAARKERR